ncbi:MAG TPA: BlaI/MecI/CopY family transcriptional regulator [Bryobacteraceae bacterium]|jgi:predicted transcriptional regulator|nr:BlaI/MecI/CopY family transcriptional regulator [Bryobacteraceae bacterium]
MSATRVSRFEMQLLEQMWKLGPASIREIQESLPEENRPAYTTVQTMIYRLEQKGAVKRVKKIGNAHVFEPVLKRKAVRGQLVSDLLELFGGSPATLVSHLIETGRLSLADVRAAEAELERRGKRS